MRANPESAPRSRPAWNDRLGSSPSRFALAVVVAATVAGALGGCAGPGGADDAWLRAPTSQDRDTIFSALDLPTPNELRLASGAPGPAYWQQQVDYSIDAEYDPATRRLVARELMTYHNNSPHALEHLWLLLEQNIFRSDSLGAALGPRTDIGMRRAEGDGFRITELALVGEPGAVGESGAVAGPGDVAGPGAEGDGAPLALPLATWDTVGRVDLPAALPPGGTLRLRIGWEFTVPEKVFRRFGLEKVAQGTVTEVAQWFPAAAVYDDVHGWNTLPYAGSGEFYTNFGDYDVRLTLPRDQVVVATGVLQNPGEVFTPAQAERLEAARTSTETVVICPAGEIGTPERRPAGDGPLTWHFRAERVRTFAFAASEAFLLDGASLDGRPGSTLLLSAYPQEGRPLWEQSTQMLRKAMAGYNARWFEYPWPVMTNVNGIEGGMEYPMIIFCGGRGSEAGLYGVTAHELGHSWFPMLVNTDERRYAWMDEGFNTFINGYSRADWFGPDEPAPRGGRGAPDNMARFMSQPGMVPIDTPPDRLPRRMLGSLEYSKTGLGLELLREQVLGPERFDAAFRAYVRRWAFKSPQPADFFRCMEDVAGADLAWFWRGWFLGTGTLDQGIESVVQPAVDVDGRPVRGANLVFVNSGGLVMPLVYRVRFEDGSEETYRLPVEVWASSDRVRETLPTEHQVVEVVIDPDEALPDTDRRDNTWSAPKFR